jgi:hypothetical protein
MRDQRDPEAVGLAILQLVEKYKVPVCEAADHYLSPASIRSSQDELPEPSTNGAAPRPDVS